MDASSSGEDEDNKPAQEDGRVLSEFDSLTEDALKEKQESLVLAAAKHVLMARKQRKIFVDKKREAFETRELPRDQ